MDTLITASIGLWNVDETYYVQIITAKEENHYFFEISIEEARMITRKENLEVGIDIWVSELPEHSIVLKKSHSKFLKNL